MNQYALDLLRNEQGSALVEVALALPLMALLLAGTINYGVYVERKMQATEAANAGAAYGAVAGNQKDATGMQNAAKAASPTLSGLTATATYFYSCSPGGAVVANTYNCSSYGTPIHYVKVVTTATVPAMIGVNGIASSVTVNGQAIYRVPWTK